MSNYINLRTGMFPVHQGDIRLEYPEMGVEFVCPEEYALIEEVLPPAYDEMTEFLAMTVENINNKWGMVWSIKPLPEDKIKELKLEIAKRNSPHSGHLIDTPGTAPNVI